MTALRSAFQIGASNVDDSLQTEGKAQEAPQRYCKIGKQAFESRNLRQRLEFILPIEKRMKAFPRFRVQPNRAPPTYGEKSQLSV